MGGETLPFSFMDITEDELKALEEQYKTAVNVNVNDIVKNEEPIAEELEEFTVYNDETGQTDTIYCTYEYIDNNYTYADDLDCLVLKQNIILVISLSDYIIEENDYVEHEGFSLSNLLYNFERNSLKFHKKSTLGYQYIKELNFYYRIETYTDHLLIYNPLDSKIYINYQHLLFNGFEKDLNGQIIKYVSKEINFSNIKNYEVFKSCLDDFYKDRWDIIPINVNNYKKNENLVIHYPEINISNSRDHKHIIKDLYVIVPLHIESENFVFSGNLYGFRTYQTSDEYSSNYIHSHLNSNKILEIGKFCLGSGDINLTIRNLMNKNNFSDVLLNGFLLTLEYYLSWESLEGGPHRKLEALFNRSTEININEIRSFSLEQTLFKKCFEKINPVYLNGVIDYNFKDLENQLFEYFNTQKVYSEVQLTGYSFLVNYDADNNKYYKIRDTITTEEDIINISNIVFKNNKLIGVVKNLNNTSQNIKRVANPQCTNYVRKKFIERIGNSFFESKRDQEIRKTYSID